MAITYTGDPRLAPAGTPVQEWPNTGTVISDGTGKFYTLNGTRKTYVPAFVVMQGYHPGDELGADGRLTPQAAQDRTAQGVPGATLFSNRGEFDPATGGWKQSINWSNIMSMAVGGLLTAGVANALMSGAAVTAPAGGTVAAADVVPASAADLAAFPGALEGGAVGAAPAGASAAPIATGAATGAAEAGIPTAASTAAGATTGVAGGTGTFDAAGNWVPDAGTAATEPAANAAGSSPNWLNAAKDIGQTATDISSGRAKGRVDESNINNSADRNLIDLYSNQIKASGDENTYGLNAARDANTYGLNSVNAGIGVGNLDLAQKNYALAAPGKRAGNSVRGDILANAQDVSIQGPSTIPTTTISGGLRPSMFSNNTRELGGLLSSQALAQQKAGDTFAPLPKVPAYQAPAPYKPPPVAPTLNGPAQANGLDTGLNAAGYAGLGADLLAKYAKYFA